MRETKPKDVAERLRKSTQWWHGDCEIKMEAANIIEQLVEERDTAEELLREYRREMTR